MDWPCGTLKIFLDSALCLRYTYVVLSYEVDGLTGKTDGYAIFLYPQNPTSGRPAGVVVRLSVHRPGRAAGSRVVHRGQEPHCSRNAT